MRRCRPARAHRQLILEEEGDCDVEDMLQEDSQELRNDTEAGREEGIVVSSAFIETFEDSSLHAPLLPQSEGIMVPETSPLEGIDRPEYLYARIIKPDRNAPVGIVLVGRHGGVYIKRIEAGSPLSSASFRPGDRIVSVNGVSTVSTSPTAVSQLIRMTPCVVSLLVRSPKHDSTLVSTCVQKPDPDCLIGIFFRKSHGRRLLISRVDPHGLAASSLLTIGHRCLSINGESYHRPHEAAAAVAAAEDFVTIISRSDAAHALVLATEKTAAWWKVVVGTATVAALFAASSMAA